MEGGTTLWQVLSVGTDEPCTLCERVTGTRQGYSLTVQGAKQNIVFFSGLRWSIKSTIDYLRSVKDIFERFGFLVNQQTLDHMAAPTLEEALADACQLVNQIDGPQALYGYSIGTGLATRTAVCAPKKPFHMALFAPFKNLSNWLNVPGFKQATGQFIGDVLDSKKAIREINVPIAIVAGEKDTVILYKQSAELAKVPNAEGIFSMLYTFPELNHATILKTFTTFVLSYLDDHSFPLPGVHKFKQEVILSVNGVPVH